MVLVSIIVGLGLTEVLTGVASLLRARGTTRYYYGPMRPVWLLAGIAIVGSTSFRPLM